MEEFLTLLTPEQAKAIRKLRPEQLIPPPREANVPTWTRFDANHMANWTTLNAKPRFSSIRDRAQTRDSRKKQLRENFDANGDGELDPENVEPFVNTCTNSEEAKATPIGPRGPRGPRGRNPDRSPNRGPGANPEASGWSPLAGPVMTTATLIAGIPAHNDTLYHRIRFAVGDPAACLELPEGRLLIVRDIEMDRSNPRTPIELPAQPTSHPKVVWMAIEKQPPHKRRPKHCVNTASRGGGRSHLGPALCRTTACRRSRPARSQSGCGRTAKKDAKELEMLHECQCVTESAVRMACEPHFGCNPNTDGVLLDEGEPLTSERMQAIIDIFLLQQGFAGSDSIVAGAKDGETATKAQRLRTEEPIIVDIFLAAHAIATTGIAPTVVHGAISDQIQGMHAAVVAAKEAAVNTHERA